VNPLAGMPQICAKQYKSPEIFSVFSTKGEDED